MPKARKPIHTPQFDAPRGYHRPNYNWMDLLHPLTLRRNEKLNIWCVMPIDYATQHAAVTAAWRIRSGDVVLPDGKWDAKAKDSKLYVMFLGKGE